MEFRNRLKVLRKEHNLSQEKLGKKLSISGPAYSKYENGHSEPSIQSLIDIANLYNVNIDYLVGRTNIKEPIDEILKSKINGTLLNQFEQLTHSEINQMQNFMSLLIKARSDEK